MIPSLKRANTANAGPGMLERTLDTWLHDAKLDKDGLEGALAALVASDPSNDHFEAKNKMRLIRVVKGFTDRKSQLEGAVSIIGGNTTDYYGLYGFLGQGEKSPERRCCNCLAPKHHLLCCCKISFGSSLLRLCRVRRVLGSCCTA